MITEIRLAKYTDLESIVEIYNQAILSGCQTGDINVYKVEERVEWFKEHEPNKYPIYVAEIDNKIIGWIALSSYRKGREGFKYTAEVSYYVHNCYTRKGVGTLLMEFMIKKAKELNYKTLIAILIESNLGSVRLLEKYHFEKWGYIPDILEIDGNIFSHLYYGRKI